MQLRPLSADPSNPTSVTLLDGTIIDYSTITFDTSSYHFAYTDPNGNVIDITATLPRSVKQTFPNFDPVTDNYRLDAEVRGRANQPGALQPLPTDVGSMFVSNVSDQISSVTHVAENTSTKIVMIVGAYLLIKLLTK